MRFVFSCGEELKPRPDPALDGDTTEEDEQTQLLREDCEAAGYASLRNNAGFGAWETRTEAFPMEQNDSLQMFEFKPPRLCVGGLIKVAARCNAPEICPQLKSLIMCPCRTTSEVHTSDPNGLVSWRTIHSIKIIFRRIQACGISAWRL